MQVMVFKINGNYYGLDTEFIDEIILRQSLVPAPCGNSCVAGLTDVRGNIYTCIDLCNVLFNIRSSWSKNQKFLLTSLDNLLIAYIVDEAVGVYDTDASPVSSNFVMGMDTNLVVGFTEFRDTLLTLLNLDGVNKISGLRLKQSSRVS